MTSKGENTETEKLDFFGSGSERKGQGRDGPLFEPGQHERDWLGNGTTPEAEKDGRRWGGDGSGFTFNLIITKLEKS